MTPSSTTSRPPAEDPFPLARVLAQVRGEDPDRVVLVGDEEPTRVGELLVGSDRLLEALGAREGRLAVVSDRYSVVLAAVALLASRRWTIGLVSPRLAPAVVREQLAAFDPALILGERGQLAELAPEAVSVPSAAPIPGAELLERPSAAPPAAGEGDAHLVLFTSGTTGAPKMVAHTEGSLLAAYRLVRGVRFELLDPEKLAELGGPGGSLDPGWYGERAVAGFPVRHLCAMPVATVAGLNIGLQALLGGEEILARPAYEPEALLDALRRFSISSVGATPAMGQALVRLLRRSGPEPDSSLLVFGLGGSVVPSGLHAEVEAAFGCQALTGYGATELGGVVATTRFGDEDADRWGSIGRPVPGVEVRTGADGVFEVRSPAMAAGYLSGDGLVHPFSTVDGWYVTGDLGERRADGVCRFLGRRSEVIVRGSRAINPADIERILERCPGVEQACVFGAPSRVAGEEDIVAAVVVHHPGVAPAELRRRCLEELGHSMVPRRVHLVERLPVTATGGIDRAALRRTLVPA